jgi:hypothetical protein
MTPSGIESVTFWLVAQRLNQRRQCAYGGYTSPYFSNIAVDSPEETLKITP